MAITGLGLLLAGCVMLPVPLQETQRRTKWQEKDVQIDEVKTAWYIPVVFSPEGPARSRSEKSQYRYFRKTHLGEEEIPCLAMESGGASGWLILRQLAKTNLMVAMRVTDSELHHEDGTLTGAVTFETVVFEGTQLRHRKSLMAVGKPGGHRQSAWDCIQGEDSGTILYYESASGPRRYDLVSDLETDADSVQVK